MPSPYQLKIITREEVAFEGEVESVIAPGIEGSLGIWANHAPLITPLAHGKLWYRDRAGEETSHQLAGGYLEVSNNVVTILAEELAGS